MKKPIKRNPKVCNDFAATVVALKRGYPVFCKEPLSLNQALTLNQLCTSGNN